MAGGNAEDFAALIDELHRTLEEHPAAKAIVEKAKPRERDMLDVMAEREKLSRAGFDPNLIPDVPDKPRVRPGELPYMPPLEPKRGPEIRNTNEPASDFIAQRTSPMIGRGVQRFLDAGRALEDTPGIGQIVRTGETLTGAPAIAEGGIDIRNGLDNGSPWRVTSGAAKVGVGAIPAAASVRALRPAMNSLPGLAVESGLGGAAAALPDRAEAAELRTPKQKAVDQLESQESEIRNQIKDIYAAQMPAAATSKGPNVRYMGQSQIKALGAAESARTQAANDAWLKTLQTRAAPLEAQLNRLQQGPLAEARRLRDEEAEKDLPFRQNHPDITMALTGGSTALAAAGPGVATFANARRLNRAMDDFRTARQAANPDVADIQRLQAEMRSRTDWQKTAKTAGLGAGAGALEYGLASAIPEELDASVGSEKAQQAAKDKMHTWDYWLTRAGLGGLAGAGGTALGFGAAKAVYPKDAEAARAMASMPALAPSAVVATQNALAGGGPQVLGPTAWPPNVRQAARDYVAQRTADLPSITTGDVMNALAQRGISANQNNVRNRLQTTKDYHEANPPQGRALQGEDVQNAPATMMDNGRRRQLLSVAPAAAVPGLTLGQKETQAPEEEGQGSSTPKPEASSSSDLPPGLGVNSAGLVYDKHTGQIVNKRYFRNRDE